MAGRGARGELASWWPEGQQGEGRGGWGAERWTNLSRPELGHLGTSHFTEGDGTDPGHLVCSAQTLWSLGPAPASGRTWSLGLGSGSGWGRHVVNPCLPAPAQGQRAAGPRMRLMRGVHWYPGLASPVGSLWVTRGSWVGSWVDPGVLPDTRPVPQALAVALCPTPSSAPSRPRATCTQWSSTSSGQRRRGRSSRSTVWAAG